MNNLIKTLILLSVSIVFSSCLTISATLTMKNDISGTLTYNASVSTLAADLEQTDRTGSLVVFPLMEDKVKTALEGAKGATLVSWKMEDDGTRYHIKGDIDFSSLESLGSFAGITVQTSKIGTDTRLELDIYKGRGENGVDSRILQVLRSGFPDDYIEIRLILPGDIIKAEGATFTGSTVTFKIKILDLLQSADDVKFAVEYR